MLPESARVAIVGAGIAGASVAHHLAERGWEEIVVIDQGPLFETGGSTSHAPGLVFQHNGSRTMTRLAQWTVERLTALDAFHPVGSIEVATTDERWAELDRRWARARGYGLDARLLDPAEVAALIPLLDPATILGGFHVADDGIAKGVRAAQALCRHEAITAIGDCEVTGLLVEGGRAVGVETAAGTLRAEHVVIACGIWGRQVSRAGAGAQRPARARRAPARLHRAAARAGGGDARGRPPDPAPPGPRDVLPPGRRRLRDRQLPPRAAAGRPRAPGRAGLHARGLRERPRRGGAAAAGAARRRAHARLQRADVVHARRLPAAGRERRGAGAVAGAGDLGHALGRLRPRAGRAHDPRRRAARPPRVRPERFDAHGTSTTYVRLRGAQGYREVYDVLHPRQQNEQARGLRTTPFYEREQAARRRPSSRAPAGSARSGTRPTPSC